MNPWKLAAVHKTPQPKGLFEIAASDVAACDVVFAIVQAPVASAQAS
jgi:hypothetical protein